MIADFFSLSVKSIRNRQVRSWLTMIGIFIGVAAVVALISLGQGLTAAINAQFATFGVDKVIVQPKSAGFGPPGAFAAGNLTSHDTQLLKNVPGVLQVSGTVIKSGTIEFGKEQQARIIQSIPTESREAELMIKTNNLEIIAGRMIRSNDKTKVLIGYNYAHGKLFTKQVSVGNKLIISGKEFEVVGILKRLGDPGTDNGIIMSEKAVEELFGTAGQLSYIVVQVKEGESLDDVTDRITRIMRRDRGLREGKEDFQIQSPQQILESFNIILTVVQAVVVGIAGISILVGAIGIMNTMYTAVLERTREIGIMKATGARNSHILYIFLIESGMLGMAGGAIGVALGVGIGKLVEAVARQALGTDLLQASFPWYLIVGALFFSFALGAVSGTLPAMQASRLKPADALRYE